jgi:phage gp36-like protein
LPYATQQNLVDRFGESEIRQISDRDGDGVADAAVIAKALADASAEIDSYIGKVYALPLATVPARVVDLAQDIALYKLFPSNPPDDVRTRYEDARRFLETVAKGLAVLPDLEGALPAPNAAGVEVSGPDRTFSRDSMKGF